MNLHKIPIEIDHDPVDGAWHVCCDRCETYICPDGRCFRDERTAEAARRVHMRWHNRRDRK